MSCRLRRREENMVEFPPPSLIRGNALLLPHMSTVANKKPELQVLISTTLHHTNTYRDLTEEHSAAYIYIYI